MAEAGVLSLLFHLVLIGFLLLSLKGGGARGGPSVYRVTLRPFSAPGGGAPRGVVGRGLPAMSPAVAKDKGPVPPAASKPAESKKPKLEKKEVSPPAKKEAPKPATAAETVVGLKKPSKKTEKAEEVRSPNRSLEDALADIRKRVALDEIQRRVARRGEEKAIPGKPREGQQEATLSQGTTVSSGKNLAGEGSGSGTGTASRSGEETGSGTGSGPGAGTGFGIGSGWGMSALESKLNDYYSVVWSKIKKEWTLPEDLPKGGTDLETVIVVVIEKNGKVQKTWFEKKSGNGLYDQMAMRSIRKAEPFPRFLQNWGIPRLKLGSGFIRNKKPDREMGSWGDRGQQEISRMGR